MGVGATELQCPLDRLCVVGDEFPDEQFESEEEGPATATEVLGMIMSSFRGTWSPSRRM